MCINSLIGVSVEVWPIGSFISEGLWKVCFWQQSSLPSWIFHLGQGVFDHFFVSTNMKHSLLEIINSIYIPGMRCTLLYVTI